MKISLFEINKYRKGYFKMLFLGFSPREGHSGYVLFGIFYNDMPVHMMGGTHKLEFLFIKWVLRFFKKKTKLEVYT